MPGREVTEDADWDWDEPLAMDAAIEIEIEIEREGEKGWIGCARFDEPSRWLRLCRRESDRQTERNEV